MNASSGRVYSDVPWLALSDLRLAGAPSWEYLDALASSWLGRPCLALPSVRIGLCWALEAQGFSRHRDHILVPRFVGRCILNSLGRFALPVESPTPQTRIALVVDQFGFRQRLDALEPQFAQAKWSYVEDSPYGIGVDEAPGHASLGRFIGLGKALPVVQGALFIPGSEAIARSIKINRQKSSTWALPVWLTMLMLRKRFPATYSDIADAAYEMYPATRGGCASLRGNLLAVFDQIRDHERESKSRLAEVAEQLRGHVIVPDQCRLGYVVPYLPRGGLAVAQAIFRKLNFSETALHIDLARNMLNPDYAKCLLIPLNSKIPQSALFELLYELRQSHSEGILD
jgi:hypothetical protein